MDFKKLLPVIVGGLVALLLVGGLVAVRGCHDRGGDDHQQVEPAREPGGILILVCDKQFPKLEQDLLVRELPAFCKSHDLEGYRWLDDREEQGLQAIEQAAKLNVPPPFVAHVKNKRMLSATAWPANVNELEKWLR